MLARVRILVFVSSTICLYEWRLVAMRFYCIVYDCCFSRVILYVGPFVA